MAVCPSCGSGNFIDCTAGEECPDCGIACGYWEGGPNEAYEAFLARRDAEPEPKPEPRREPEGER